MFLSQDPSTIKYTTVSQQRSAPHRTAPVPVLLSRSSVPLTRQHDLKNEADIRQLLRSREILDRRKGAVGLLDAEEAVLQAARREEQIAGPWGVEMAEVGRSTDDVGSGEGEQSFRQAKAGTQDGLGVFGVSVENGDFHAFTGGGNKAGVDDAEVQLFQPLQQAAHEER